MTDLYFLLTDPLLSILIFYDFTAFVLLLQNMSHNSSFTECSL